MNALSKKKFFEAIRLFRTFFEVQTTKIILNTPLKFFFEVVQLFQSFYEVRTTKIILNTPSKKFF